LSTATKIVECAFGILYSKRPIISKAIEMEVELADKIVNAFGFCIIL